MPKISVIIPSFNCSHLILEAIQSVLDQTFRDFEIIVIDDGSTDGTGLLLKPLADNNSIRYVYQANRGLSNARNLGIRMAKGQFIKFLDADDFLSPMQLEQQVKHLENKEETVISITDYEVKFQSGKKISKKINLGQGYQVGKVMGSNFGPIHACLISRSLVDKIGGFNEELSSNEDVEFWIRALLIGGHFERLDYVGCCYRIVSGSVSSNATNQFKDLCKVIENTNKEILKKFNQMPKEDLVDIIESNTKLVHMCYVRKINLDSTLPNLLKVSDRICKEKMSCKISIFGNIFGFKGVAYLKYMIYRLKYQNYDATLLNNTSWRNEPKGSV